RPGGKLSFWSRTSAPSPRSVPWISMALVAMASLLRVESFHHTTVSPSRAALTTQSLQRLSIQVNTQAWAVRNSEVTLSVGREGLGDQVVEINTRGQVLNVAGHGHRRRQVQIRCQPNGRVPAVRHPLNVMFIRHPRNPPCLRQSTAFRAVR